MERIASFSVDHLLLEPGVYVSRIDRDPATGTAVTTSQIDYREDLPWSALQAFLSIICCLSPAYT